MEHFYRCNVHYDGMFMFYPFRYDHGKLMTIITPQTSYNEFLHYIETETGCPMGNVYFSFPECGLENIMRIGSDKDCATFFDIGHTYGTLDVYVDQFLVDLSDYVNEGELEGEPEGQTKHGESSRAGEGDDEGDSDDEEYDASEDSDVESVVSLDHISEGEDELRKVRKGNY